LTETQIVAAVVEVVVVAIVVVVPTVLWSSSRLVDVVAGVVSGCCWFLPLVLLTDTLFSLLLSRFVRGCGCVCVCDAINQIILAFIKKFVLGNYL